jgi:high affinity sulfate transporter 1
MRKYLPILEWLPTYRREWLRPDIVAGITLAAYMLPVALAYASLAGLPPQAGLYSCMLAGLFFAPFCTARHTAVAVTSAISLLLAATLSGMAQDDAARYWSLASFTALLVAAIAIVAGLLGAGTIIHFISETVLAGFKAGVALNIISTQLPKLLGIKGSGDNFFQRVGYVLEHVDETSALTLAVGVTGIVLLAIGERVLRNRPVALIVVVLSIVAVAAFGLDQRGLKVLGDVPSGLPRFGLPLPSIEDLNELVPLALACFLLGSVETMAVSRTFARKHRYRVSADQDFLALGAANLVAGLAQGYPVSGGMSQSAVNEKAGAKTPVSLVVASLLIALVTLFLSGVFRTLPDAILAAIVVMAVKGLIDVSLLRHLYRFSLGEFAIAAVALVGVLALGLLNGVLIGCMLSLILLLRRSSRPSVAVMGRVPGTDRFGSIERHPDNEPVAGVLVFRVDSSIFYYNTEHVRDRFFQCLAEQQPPPRLVVWSLMTTPLVDLAGAELLMELRQDLGERGIELKLAEARGPLREVLRVAGLEKHFGPIQAHTAIAPTIQQWEASTVAPASLPAGTEAGPTD